MSKELTLTVRDPNQIDLYEHGFVRLVDYVGDEVSVVNAARVSFHKEVRGMQEGDKKLIAFLLREHHGTPFEQGFMAQFHIRVPIFVMREWIRHRVGFSYNEESGRYVELRPDFFIPEEGREQIGKPGAYEYVKMEEQGKVEWFKGLLKLHSERGFDYYRQALDYGFAKEQARLFLGLNLYTEFRWTCNARSLLNFLALRNDAPAMEEIRTYAAAIEKIFAEEMPIIHGAFEEAGRVAP
jgi:thymidylate synthase (FAD)